MRSPGGQRRIGSAPAKTVSAKRTEKIRSQRAERTTNPEPRTNDVRRVVGVVQLWLYEIDQTGLIDSVIRTIQPITS